MAADVTTKKPSKKLLTPKEVRTALRALRGWEYDEELKLIWKTYKVRGFSGAMGLVGKIAVIAAAWDHHPDIDIRYDKVRVMYTTHHAGGLTGYDIACARLIEDKDDPV
jgi:4a-hydroxytetrahydrobiopterin dehydratase